MRCKKFENCKSRRTEPKTKKAATPLTLSPWHHHSVHERLCPLFNTIFVWSHALTALTPVQSGNLLARDMHGMWLLPKEKKTDYLEHRTYCFWDPLTQRISEHVFDMWMQTQQRHLLPNILPWHYFDFWASVSKARKSSQITTMKQAARQSKLNLESRLASKNNPRFAGVGLPVCDVSHISVKTSRESQDRQDLHSTWPHF